MLKNWLKPLVLIGLFGIILYSGVALNVFDVGHAHSHAHSDNGIAEHHHSDKEPQVEKKPEVENQIIQPENLQDQNESKHNHDGHNHKH